MEDQQYLDTDEGVIYVRLFLKGKPPVLLLHGFGDSGECWMPTVQALKDDFDVIIPDLPAHGKSKLSLAGSELDLSNWLIELIHKLNYTKLRIIGHSIGASTAAQAAATTQGLITTLILLDPPWTMPTDRLSPPPTRRLRLPIQDICHAPLQDIMQIGQECNSNWSDIDLTHWAAAKQELDQRIFACQPKFEPWTAVVERIRTCCLLVYGDNLQGGRVTPSGIEMIQRINPNIQTVKIDGAGHYIHFDKPGELMRLVTRFLSDQMAG
jgi:pimeloyl-ACP methyl ester carboxylesterase